MPNLSTRPQGAGPERLRMGLTGWGWDPRGGVLTDRGGLWAGPTKTRTQAGSERDPEGEGGAEATHCGYQVLHGPAEPHAAAEAQLQVLQGGTEARGHLDRSHPGDRGLWVLHPPSWLLPSLWRPTSLSTLVRGGTPTKRTDSDQSAHVCAHAPSPLLGTLPGKRIRQRRTFLRPHWWLIGPPGGAALNQQEDYTEPVASCYWSPTVYWSPF